MGARLAWNNLLTAPAPNNALITSSSEATGYVDDNLLNPARWKVWQSASQNTDQWVKFNLSVNQTMQAFAAIDPVIHPGGSLRVQANATDVWTSPTINDVFTVPPDDWTRVWTVWKTTTFSLRWVRFYFTNTSAVTSQVSLGAAFAGTFLEPVRSIGSSLHLEVVDPSITRVAMGGQRSTLTKPKYHTVSGMFPVQKAKARNDLRRAYAYVGTSLPSVLTLDPNDPTLTFYGTLSGTLAADLAGADYWNIPIEFVEDVA